MRASHYFTYELFELLSELSAHNNRNWFQKNKQRYQTQVRDPMLRFIGRHRPRPAQNQSADCR